MQKGIEVEEVHAPNGGLVDTVQLDLLRGSEASAMVSMHHDRLALERREGFVQIGSPTPDVLSHGGYHYRRSDNNVWQIMRVQVGGFNGTVSQSYLYKGTGAAWSAAVSNGVAAGAPDVIGNGHSNGNGTFVQYANRLYWYDAGTLHRLWDGAAIRNYGIFNDSELPAGTASSSAEVVAGDDGNPFSLTFATSSYVSVVDADLSGAVAFTVSAWVKAPAGTATRTIFCASNDNAGTPSRVAISINKGGRAVLCEMWGGGTFSYRKLYSTAAINDGVWHLVVFTRNTGSQIFMYVDGNGIQGSPCGLTALSIATAYIGAYRSAGTNTAYWAGNIDDVRVYARGLLESEIVELYRGCPVSTTSLVGHWKFDDGTGTTTADAGTGGNTGTLVGSGMAWSNDSAPTPNPCDGDADCALLAGSFGFVYTYYNPLTGEESNPSAVSNVVTFGAAGGSLQATVPANAAWVGSGFTTINFYRTTVDGAAYLFDHAVTNVAALPITEELCKPDEDLASEARFDHGPIPRLRFCILFAEMIVGAGNPESPSTVYWSEAGDPTHWPPNNAQDIDRDNGDPVTGIFRLLGRLFVVKETSGIYMLTPQYASDGSVSFSVDAITNDWGCLSHHSIVVIDTFAYWVDVKGICKFNGQQVENVSDPKIRQRWKYLVTQKGVERFQIGPSLDAVREAGYKPPGKQSFATQDRQADHQYYRLTTQDYGGPNDDVSALDLILDTSIGCWFEDGRPDRTAGKTMRTSWLVKDASGQYAVFEADETGRCFRLRTDMGGNTVYDDAGWPLASRWKSKSWGGIDGVLPVSVDLEYERSTTGSTAGPVTVNLYTDGQTTPRVVDTTSLVLYDVNSPAPGNPDSRLPDPTRATHQVTIMFDREWCRRFQFEVVVNKAEADLRILQYRIRYVRLGDMQKAG